MASTRVFSKQLSETTALRYAAGPKGRVKELRAAIVCKDETVCVRREKWVRAQFRLCVAASGGAIFLNWDLTPFFSFSITLIAFHAINTPAICHFSSKISYQTPLVFANQQARKLHCIHPNNLRIKTP